METHVLAFCVTAIAIMLAVCVALLASFAWEDFGGRQKVEAVREWFADKRRTPAEREQRQKQLIADSRLVAASYAYLSAPPGDEGKERRERSIDEMETVRFGGVLGRG